MGHGKKEPAMKYSSCRASRWTGQLLVLCTSYVLNSCINPHPVPSEPSPKSLHQKSELVAKAEVTIRLGAWNIKKLGHGSSKDYELLAQVIDENFDIIAVVEVMQKGGGHPGYDELLKSLGEYWDGFVTETPRPNTSSGNAEFYAILWREGSVQPCEGWEGLRYHEDNDGSGEGNLPDLFDREPAYGCFEAGMGVDFLLAAYHARWADGDTDEIKGEAQHIDDVLQAMADAVEGEDDLLIVGDFNLRPDDLAATVTAADRTAGEGSTLNTSGAITGNLYDHVLVGDVEATSEMMGDAKVLDVRGVAESPEVFYKTVSDHLPIVVEMDVSGPDDDPS
jgi:endonuclease/exonuclease/phosphatase family metal-dependent hydrolase